MNEFKFSRQQELDEMKQALEQAEATLAKGATGVSNVQLLVDAKAKAPHFRQIINDLQSMAEEEYKTWSQDRRAELADQYKAEAKDVLMDYYDAIQAVVELGDKAKELNSTGYFRVYDMFGFSTGSDSTVFNRICRNSMRNIERAYNLD